MAIQTRLIKLPEVTHRTTISRSGIYRLIANGEFPEQIKLTERSSAWSLEEVTNWIDKRASLRNRNIEAQNDATALKA